jgi:predicted thioesterase
MRYYNDPTIKDVMTEIAATQKQIKERRPHLLATEYIVEVVGWAGLEVDIAEIKEAVQS